MPDREKYKHMQGHSKSHFETGIPVWAPKHCAKKFDQFKKKSLILPKIHLCAFGAFQQTKLISLRKNSIKSDQKYFSAAYRKKYQMKKM